MKTNRRNNLKRKIPKQRVRVNWNEEELRNWLDTKKPDTRYVYRKAFETYVEFTGLTAEQLIDEAEIDFHPDTPQRNRGKVKRRLLAYRSWLANHYKPKNNRAGDGGLAPKTVNTYLGALRGFYDNNNFPIKFKRNEIPTAQPRTERMMLKPEQVKTLLRHARTQRNKAIIMCLYQSGMDISTLLSLNYAHVEEGRRNRRKRILVKVVRPKVNHKYRTFFGQDATVSLNQYLDERRNLTRMSPLFLCEQLLVNDEPKRRATEREVQNMFKRLAIRAGFVTEEQLENEFAINPCGSHALRASFSKIAVATGINQNLIDYLMGHKTQYSGVYSTRRVSDRDLERSYSDLEPRLQTSPLVTSAVDRLREQAKLWDIDLDDLIERKGRELYETGTGFGGGSIADWEALETPEGMAELLRDEIKRIVRGNGSPRREKEQRVIDESELEGYLLEDWKYVSSLNSNSGKCVIERG